MTLRSGVDLIEISRVAEVIARHGSRYLERIYTAGELEHCGRNVESLAGRFAAKEAVAKALGTGIGQVAWKEIEILGDEQNAPMLHLSGVALQVSNRLGLKEWSLSISHSLSQAVAIAVAIG